MDDVSSAPLGFLLAALALWTAASYGGWLLLPLGLLHANFVLDTAVTLIRRIARGERWYAPHREHFYQRLVRAGKSHSWVTGWEAGLQVLALLLLLASLQAALLVQAFLYLSVVLLWLGFFAYAEVVFRRSQAIESSASAHSNAPAV